MKTLGAIVAFFCLCLSANAQTKSEGTLLKARIIYGQRFGIYKLTRSGAGKTYSLSFSSNYSGSRTAEISESDKTYILQRFSDLPFGLDTPECRRNSIEIQSGENGKVKVSCLSDPNQLSESYRKFLDVLALGLRRRK